jgi:hypothetical protein
MAAIITAAISIIPTVFTAFFITSSRHLTETNVSQTHK